MHGCVAVLAIVVGLVGCAAVPTTPPAPRRTTSLGVTVSSVTLGNGLRVVLVRDPSASDVQVTTRYRVGAADDPAGREGMAHVVEHLMFQQVLGAETVFAQLETNTTYFNATTTHDATTYVARAEPAQLDKLLAIEGVRMGFRCTTITESVFAREREVVVNEQRYRSDASEIYARLLAGLFPANHPYQRDIGGTAKSVGAITFAEACAFADLHYTPDNAVVVVAGALSGAELDAALARFLGRIGRRAAPVRAPVPAPDVRRARREIQLPLPGRGLMLAWPLPEDPLVRTRLRALSSAVVRAIDGAVGGRVTGGELGDERATLFVVNVELADDESSDEVLASIDEALGELPAQLERVRVGSLAEIAFDGIQQAAIHELYARLEADSDRDARLAAYVLAGRDPAEALAGEFAGVRDMTNRNAASLAAEYFAAARSTVAVLRPTKAAARTAQVELRAPVHDRGLQRAVVDPAEARAGLAVPPERNALASVVTRRLPNGLRVVLLPATSVPTVDIKLLFEAGSADEPATRRGVSLLSAHALSWSLRYINDMLQFVAAGGTSHVDVGTDRTTFTIRGVDMHLDYLLAALRRWVRDGIYDSSADGVLDVIRQRKASSDGGAVMDAWREALFGTTHPYARAGLVRHASRHLTVEDAEQFRAANYTPDNATLIIAGRFDPVIAEQWIEFLFGDWTGVHAPVTRSAVRYPGASSLAIVADGATLEVDAVMPARLGSRTQQLVAAAMLHEAAQRIRHQLGAAYAIDAHLVEYARGSFYQLRGSVDPLRASEAVRLLREHLAALRASPESAAAAFVVARKRVVSELRRGVTSAAALARVVEQDIELGRAPLSSLLAIPVVAKLTVDDIASVLADLDLELATVLMRGPETALERAFADLGRTPRLLAIDKQATPAVDAPRSGRTRQEEVVTMSDVEEALTVQRRAPRSRFTFTIAPGYMQSRLVDTNSRIHKDCCTGAQVVATAGYVADAQGSLGVRASVGSLGGSYTIDLSPLSYAFSLTTIDIAAYVQLLAFDRLWTGVSVGLHLDRVTEPSPDTISDSLRWHRGVGLGLLGGVDLVEFAGHRVGVFGAVDGTLATDTGHAALTLGLAYRR
jgi:zinc protease